MTDTVWTLDRLRWQVCGRKSIYGQRTARLVAEHKRAQGERITAYRCPFSDDCGKAAHWHIGHPPRMATLVMIARAIRGLPIIDDRPLPSTADVGSNATVDV